MAVAALGAGLQCETGLAAHLGKGVAQIHKADFHLAQRQGIHEAINLRYGQLAQVIRYLQGKGQNHTRRAIKNNVKIALLECRLVGTAQRAIVSQIQAAIGGAVFGIRMQHDTTGVGKRQVGCATGNTQAVNALDRIKRHAARTGTEGVQRRISARIVGKSRSTSGHMVIEKELTLIGPS